MPPKKDGPTLETCIAGYDNKETRLLAAAFVSSIGPDKYNYALFAQLSGFTEGTLKKFWPPVKKKVIEEHSGFGKFIAGSCTAAAPTSKAAAGRKRKAADADGDAELESNASSAKFAHRKASEGKTRKASAKGKRDKKPKTEEAEEEKATAKEENNSLDGGDGLGEFVYKQNVVEWLESTDGPVEEA